MNIRKFFGLNLKGKCKRCGHCCRNITFMIKDSYVATEQEFEFMKELNPKHNHFYISGRDDDGALLFTCKSMGEDNLCKDYNFRSLYCRFYPWILFKSINAGYELPEECGYYVE